MRQVNIHKSLDSFSLVCYILSAKNETKRSKKDRKTAQGQSGLHLFEPFYCKFFLYACTIIQKHVIRVMDLLVALKDIGKFRVLNVAGEWTLIRTVSVTSHPCGILVSKSIVRHLEESLLAPGLLVDSWLLFKNLASNWIGSHLQLNVL